MDKICLVGIILKKVIEKKSTMQVSNSLNNVIRILFNPKVEAFKLFDFLVVKSDTDRYIAQITEIYDDKFDASQNVARLKLFYKINNDDEVMPYDNFTPNKECEIIKVKQEDIESFLNNNKETFVFGENKKTSQPLNIQYDFFNNNAVIISDKIEAANTISVALAKKLSAKKHSIIIDSTGIVELEEAKKIKASEDFKMPLNYSTIDFIFDKCLTDASLEFQVKCGDILNEIKEYAKTQEGNFIPFNTFIKVLKEQYEATPFVELELLISRLNRLQIEGIFAKNKKEYESLFEVVNKNEVTIIDLSQVNVFWQKAYLEYIIDGLEDEVYLITRINDENCDHNLLRKIYCKKRNIKFIPNVSYIYKKLPSVVQYCKNYVLMQSLYQRNDFLNANFALANLVADECIVFGKNTDDFLYLVTNYELKVEEKKIEYRKIALSLLDDEKEEVEITEEEKTIDKTDSQKLIEELNKFDNERNAKDSEDAEVYGESTEIEAPAQEIVEEKGSDYFEGIVNASETKIEPEAEIVTDNFNELSNDAPPAAVILSADKIEEDVEENNENVENTENIINTEINPDETTKEDSYDIKMDSSDIEIADDSGYEIKEEKPVSNESKEELELSDDELDFFQMARESSESEEIETDSKESVQVDEVEEVQKTEETVAEEESEEIEEHEEVNLSEIADNSIDNSFEEIINSKSDENSSDIVVNDEVKIDSNLIESPEKEENLPIFKEELSKSEEETTFKEGDKIKHKKYGVGTVIKTIQYEKRQFVQVEFETSGRILLDPKVADIKLEY